MSSLSKSSPPAPWAYSASAKAAHAAGREKKRARAQAKPPPQHTYVCCEDECGWSFDTHAMWRQHVDKAKHSNRILRRRVEKEEKQATTLPKNNNNNNNDNNKRRRVDDVVGAPEEQDAGQESGGSNSNNHNPPPPPPPPYSNGQIQQQQQQQQQQPQVVVPRQTRKARTIYSCGLTVSETTCGLSFDSYTQWQNHIAETGHSRKPCKSKFDRLDKQKLKKKMAGGGNKTKGSTGGGGAGEAAASGVADIDDDLDDDATAPEVEEEAEVVPVVLDVVLLDLDHTLVHMLPAERMPRCLAIAEALVPVGNDEVGYHTIAVRRGAGRLLSALVGRGGIQVKIVTMNRLGAMAVAAIAETDAPFANVWASLHVDVVHDRKMGSKLLSDYVPVPAYNPDNRDHLNFEPRHVLIFDDIVDAWDRASQPYIRPAMKYDVLAKLSIDDLVQEVFYIDSVRREAMSFLGERPVVVVPPIVARQQQQQRSLRANGRQRGKGGAHSGVPPGHYDDRNGTAATSEGASRAAAAASSGCHSGQVHDRAVATAAAAAAADDTGAYISQATAAVAEYTPHGIIFTPAAAAAAATGGDYGKTPPPPAPRLVWEALCARCLEAERTLRSIAARHDDGTTWKSFWGRHPTFPSTLQDAARSSEIFSRLTTDLGLGEGASVDNILRLLQQKNTRRVSAIQKEKLALDTLKHLHTMVLATRRACSTLSVPRATKKKPARRGKRGERANVPPGHYYHRDGPEAAVAAVAASEGASRAAAATRYKGQVHDMAVAAAAAAADDTGAYSQATAAVAEYVHAAAPGDYGTTHPPS